MKMIQKFLNIKEMIRENILRYYGRFIRQLEGKKFILSMILTLAILILFYVDNDTVEKIGTVASVVIAAIVCKIQINSYKKERMDRRETEAFKKCRFITENIIRQKGKPQQDLRMDYTGENGKQIRTYDGRHYALEWKLEYLVHSNRCKFLMIVGHYKNSRKMELTERDEYFEFDLNNGINSFSVGWYVYMDGEPPMRKKIPTSIDKFSDTEWNTMLELMSGILPDYFP